MARYTVALWLCLVAASLFHVLVAVPVEKTGATDVAAPTTTEVPATTEEETTPPPIVCTDPREMYDECGSACGDRTCENQRRSDVHCTKQCVEGCFCRNGYVRDKDRNCIPAYRCGRAPTMMAVVRLCCLLVTLIFVLHAAEGAEVCRYGERWRCGSTACEKTCYSVDGEVCDQPCTNGCYCDQGFVRGPFGNCSPLFVCRYKGISGRMFV
uniref:TIL domain-containing protein n=1 Tax=Anopheles dirus TaxID=7168 RepID=A0A182N7E6_9DIPT